MENYLQPFDVCIVCALPEEARALLAVVKPYCEHGLEEHTSSRYGYSYRSAVLKNNKNEPLTLHISWLPRYGPEEMTLHLSRVLEECQPRIAIMTGICAGDAERVQLGDLVVAERTFTYDSGKFTLDDDGRRVHLHDTMTYQLDGNILQFLGVFDEWKPLVTRLKRPPFPPEQRKRPKMACHIKPMASGSAVRADHPFDDVRAPVRGTVAIDMEGAAFGLVLSRHPLIRWLVVKGVCDYADREKNDTYHDYAARVSALYALSSIQAYVSNERLPRLNRPFFPNIARAGIATSTNLLLQDEEIEKHVKELDKYIKTEINNTTFDIRALAELGLVALPNAIRIDTPIAYTSRRPQWFATASIQIDAPSDSTEFKNIDECLTHYRGRLLLLGEPGSGKTTTLLQFAQRRIVDWQKGLGGLLPIYSPIYTWNGSMPLLNWLSRNTGVGIRTLQRLIDSEAAIFLLDGLDELELTNRRVEFIKLVNELSEVPLIMTCRTKVYDALLEESDQRIALNGAATLNPLHVEQVKSYLSNLPDLWIAAQDDSELLEMIRNPLLLTLFIVGYKEKPQDIKSLRNLGGSPFFIRNRLFETFIEKRYEFEKSRSTQDLAYTLEELYEIMGAEIFYILGNALVWVEYGFYWEKVGAFFLLLRTPFGDFVEKLHLMVKRKFFDEDRSKEWEYYRFSHGLFLDYFTYKYWIKMSQSDNPSDRYSAIWAASWFDEWGDDALVLASNDSDEDVRRRAFSKMFEQKRWNALKRAGDQLDPQERDRIRSDFPRAYFGVDPLS